MKELFRTLFAILKFAGRTITVFRNVVVNTIFLGLIALLLFSLFSTKDEKVIQENSALLLTISGNVVEEKKMNDPFNEIFNESLGFSRLPEETHIQDILDAIASAAKDQSINSIVLNLHKMGQCSLNHIQDIGKALEKFKLTGKRVIAAEDYYTQSRYLLASYASKVFLNPMGVVDLHGFGAYRLYFKDALEKLRINYHVFQIGTYKSALEPITRNSMSEEARDQNTRWLNSLWGSFTGEILTRRNISQSTLEKYTNNIAHLLQQFEGDTAQLAYEISLVDELKSREELNAYLVALTGKSVNRSFRYITLREYLREISRSYIHRDEKDTIGVIVAQGNILTGEQAPGTIGGETLVKRIRKAREDSSVKGVVLRIDSGGGSVFASEMIRKELAVLRDSGKPLVVSMGSMAASGGYWIAAEADEIWAYPTTLTGSIGIFGAIPTFEETLQQYGITGDGIGTTELATGINLAMPLSPGIKAAVQSGIEHGYTQFLDIVSTGRNLEGEKLQQVAEGRVFDGRTAKKLGLIDKLGNLEEAIESTAELAGLDDYSAAYISTPSSFSQRFIQQLQSSLKSAGLFNYLPDYIRVRISEISSFALPLADFNDPRGLYAHCMINFLSR